MSNTIRTYKQPEIEDIIDDSRATQMHLTAFCGGEELGRAVQITIDGYQRCLYFQLGEKQIADLIMVLTKRLRSESGYRATDGDMEAIVDVDGIAQNDLVHEALEKTLWSW